MKPEHEQATLRVVFAGGGTGGHVMPGVATAHALRRLVPGAQCLFLATSRPSEREFRRALAPFEVMEIPAARWGGLAQKLRFAAAAPLAADRALEVLRAFHPHLVVGLGGYSSVLPVLTARALALPTMLFESNAVPGRVVRALAPVVDCVQLQWEVARRHLLARETIVTGNPVRDSLLGGHKIAARCRLGLAAYRCTVLVMGGSQGARALNRTLASALRHLSKEPDMLPDGGLQVLHLTGAERLTDAWDAPCDAVRYRPVGFLHRMADAYAAADLAVSRAGGSSLAELTAVGLPSVLVPYPHAADDHQTANAAVVAEAGAALAVSQAKLTGGVLAKLISELARDPKRLDYMASRARALGRPDAADAVARHIAAMAHLELQDAHVVREHIHREKTGTSLSRAA